jgi:DNA-directed RNA polymerase II subunit RPB11
MGRRNAQKKQIPVCCPGALAYHGVIRPLLTCLGTPNSSVFTFNKEDHTLANMLRSALLKDPHVTFAGYKSMYFYLVKFWCSLTQCLVPHPLFAKFELRIQTDGDVTPKEALVNCSKQLVSDLEILSREFTKEYELRKMVSGDGAAAAATAEK